MRSLQVRWLGLTAVVSFMLGCSSPVVEVPAEPCETVAGKFEADLQFIEGTCEPDYEAPGLKFDADDPRSTTRTETRFTDTLTTETLRTGCQIEMKQTLTSEENNRTRAVLESTLLMESESELSGTIDLTEYEADGTTPHCSATYDAVYTLKDVLVVDAPK